MKRSLSSMFFSDSKYLFLPTKKNPRVALAMDNIDIAKNSFNLYNPFTRKARLLKFLTMNSYFLLELAGFFKKMRKTVFVEYLESLLGERLIVSVYFSTNRRKVVLQLQNMKAEVIAYIKIALDEIARHRLVNEKKAITLLYSKGIRVPNLIYSGVYEDLYFLILEEFGGNYGLISDSEIWEILNSLRKNNRYLPLEHPRIQGLLSLFDKYQLFNFSRLLFMVAQRVQVPLYEVYEHGDFTPWNIVSFKNGFGLLDLEYFEENGLEYMDYIKYYFQVFHLLKGMKDKKLLKSLLKRFKFVYKRELLILFLLKEIALKVQENVDFTFEKKLLKLLEATL